jgi:hypothetical protein
MMMFIAVVAAALFAVASGAGMVSLFSQTHKNFYFLAYFGVLRFFHK